MPNVPTTAHDTGPKTQSCSPGVHMLAEFILYVCIRQSSNCLGHSHQKTEPDILAKQFSTVTLGEQVTTQKEYILCLVHQSQPVLLKLQKQLLPGGWSVFKESKAGGIFTINSVTYITTHCRKKDEQVIYLWVVDLSSSLHFHKFS